MRCGGGREVDVETKALNKPFSESESRGRDSSLGLKAPRDKSKGGGWDPVSLSAEDRAPNS